VIETCDDGNVTVLTLARPPVNALDLGLLDALTAALRNQRGPVVITGRGNCFSAGVDLRAILDGGETYTGAFLNALVAAFRAVFDHPAPVVAAINGHAIAGGCVIAMAADVRLMSGATIGISEIAVGVPFPAAALEICRYAMGPSVANAALGGESVPAEVALARGWIDAVVEPGDLLELSIARARALGEHSPTAYAFTKSQLHGPARAAIDAGAVRETAVRDGWTAAESRTRIAAFLEALRH
jgi:enoyl-CoA hydratase